MPETPQAHDVETMLERLGEEMAPSGSIAPDILDRVAAEPAPTTRRSARWWAGGLAAAAAACALTTWLLLPPARPPGQFPVESPYAAPLPDGTARVEAGGVALTQHFATVVDSRGVLVFWSWRDGRNPGRAASPPRQDDRYTEHTLRSGRDPDGTVWRWSLFLARATGRADSQLPLLRVPDRDGDLLCLSAWPQPTGEGQLRKALATCAAGGREAPTLSQIRQLLRSAN